MTDPTPLDATPEHKPEPRPSPLTPGRMAGAALALSVVALGAAVLPYATGGDFGGKVRAYLLANPQVLDEVLAARQAAQDGAVVDTINQAAAANPDLLAIDPRDPTFGPTDAKVTVIQFFDFRCPGCKAVAPEFRALMTAHPEVRFVFKDWPILDRPDDDGSTYAARAALAAHQQGQYLAVYEGLMAEPALDRAAVDRILSENGVALAAAQAAITSDDVTRHIADIHTTAAALQLHGTPTFFVNGQAQPSIDPRALNAAIEAAK